MIQLNQISTNLISPKTNSVADSYYEEIWNVHKKDGYVKPEHFWEIPLWITRVSAILKKNNDNHRLNIITDENIILKGMLQMFSVLEVNKYIIKKIIKNNPTKTFYLGGYINGKEFFKDCDNTFYYESLEELSFQLGYEWSDDFNYELFENYETIPRLQLSTECKYNCKFCTIENKVKENNLDTIIKQAEQFKNLKFKLIYIDDKTFGQANNYYLLDDLYIIIKRYNPEFKGFIVQSTANDINKMHSKLEKLHIFAVEIGVESFNDNILRLYRKPAKERSIITATGVLNYLNIKFIPNIIIGFPEETKSTYTHTLKFLENFKHSTYFSNMYNLAVYKESDLSNTIKINDSSDSNESIVCKSYNSEEKNKLYTKYSNLIFLQLLQNLRYVKTKRTTN